MASFMVRVCMGVSILTAIVATAVSAEELTYVDLVSRLTDLERLALLPQDGERCGQCSSWDRKSRYDESTGQYVDWAANADGTGVIREKNGGIVMAEMTGPGCIWRIWSAKPEEGHVRIYLDGAAEPAVDLPFRQYFDRTAEPFTRKALVYNDAATGCDCYVPIPYEKSCKIVADPGWGCYYHFTFSTFPEGTHVTSFKRELTPVESMALDEANSTLLACGPREAKKYPDSQHVRQTLVVKRHKSVKVLDAEGPAAITAIRVWVPAAPYAQDSFIKAEPGKPNEKVEHRDWLPEREAQRTLLRDLAISIRWDDEEEPSVWAPLGDFFGTAAGANPFRALPTGLTESGIWYANWYMPFDEEAEVTISNDGDIPREVRIDITYAPLTRSIADFGRFHAKWHRDAMLPEAAERAIDWPILKCEGRGRYCGVMLHVWNPKGGWWGEGDEKFFVDGEKFPSTFGTGSEDYFGYAWGNATLFSKAYHSQTCVTANVGHVSVNRFQVVDNVPFQHEFEGCIEKYFPNDRPCVFAAVAYWYLAADGQDPYGAAPIADRTGYYTPIVPPARELGAIEGEEMAVIEASGGIAATQDLFGFDGHWSGMAHLFWTGAKQGDTLKLTLPVEKAGKYQMLMRFTQAPDYGVIQASLDGQDLQGAVDLFGEKVAPFGPFNMATLELTAGERTLMFKIVGANAKAKEGCRVGLDYVKLVPTN